MRTRMGFEYGSPADRWKVYGNVLALSERCKGRYIVVSPEQCEIIPYDLVLNSPTTLACFIIHSIYSVFNVSYRLPN